MIEAYKHLEIIRHAQKAGKLLKMVLEGHENGEALKTAIEAMLEQIPDTRKLYWLFLMTSEIRDSEMLVRANEYAMSLKARYEITE